MIYEWIVGRSHMKYGTRCVDIKYRGRTSNREPLIVRDWDTRGWAEIAETPRRLSV